MNDTFEQLTSRQRSSPRAPMRVLLSVLITLSGCSPRTPSSPPTGIADIGDSTWTLLEFDGSSVSQTSPRSATVTFRRDGSISGTAACNEGGSPVRWTIGKFTQLSGPGTSPLPIFTAMRCLDDASSEIGNRFWTKMMKARAWARDGDTLEIAFDDGSYAKFGQPR
jgi:heat shock protein HslJ